mgnify:CR=1 FL=1
MFSALYTSIHLPLAIWKPTPISSMSGGLGSPFLKSGSAYHVFWHTRNLLWHERASSFEKPIDLSEPSSREGLPDSCHFYTVSGSSLPDKTSVSSLFDQTKLQAMVSISDLFSRYWIWTIPSVISLFTAQKCCQVGLPNYPEQTCYG